MQAASPLLPFFVYGLLRPGLEGFVELGLVDRVDSRGSDRIVGTLYDLGNYPGLIPGGDKVIIGELLMPRDAGVITLMDTYELYDPADSDGSEYLRVTTTTLDRGVDVWVYAYNRSVEGYPQLSDGIWRKSSDSSSRWSLR